VKLSVFNRWVKNLESGEYKQGQGRLHNPAGGFCCLGVLLDAEIDGEWELTPSGTAYELNGAGYLPNGAQQVSLGLTSEVVSQVASQNDGGRTFKSIAKWLRRNKKAIVR